MRRVLALIGLGLAVVSNAGHIPSPKEFFGHDVCEDYWLANYAQLTDYWKALAKASPRFTFQSIGKTEDGRDQWMAIITDPGNRHNLDNYRKACERLCRAKDFRDDDEARAFAGKQKAVVWIDGGIHATEVLATQQLLETAYQLVSRTDKENNRILKDDIILLAHANPDGMDWVSDWYMRKEDPKARSLNGLPFLYQKYIGHDDNRDFYANNMAETKNINRVLYQEWFPQIVYNHHQAAPAGTIMFIPPFRNPFNYNMDPMTDIATDLVGTHMHQRLIAEGKSGTAMRGATLYSTWWNGGLRTTTYFHNMVGILTETWGNPSPGPLPFTQRFQIPTSDVPFPVEGGKMWHIRDSLAYEVSANYAILDYASRYRERLLFDFYRAGRNSIERGSKDTWSRYPSRITAMGADALKKPELRDARMYVIPSNQPDFPTACKFVEKLMQCGVEVEVLTEDTPVSASIINSVAGPIEEGIGPESLSGKVARPSRPCPESISGDTPERGDQLTSHGKPAQRGEQRDASPSPFQGERVGLSRGRGEGWPPISPSRSSDVVPHSPNRHQAASDPGGVEELSRGSREPGVPGEAIPPVDTDSPHPGGVLESSPRPDKVWQAGSFVIRCDQAFRPHILDMFEPQDHPNDFQYPGGPPIPPYDSAGYTLAFQMGVKFDRVLDPVELKTEGITALPSTREAILVNSFTVPGGGRILSATANESFKFANDAFKSNNGLSRTDASQEIEGRTVSAGAFVFETPGQKSGTSLTKPRLALWDRYGGSMESGWTRWVLEQFAFDFDVVYPPDLDAGDLNSKYDAIIFPTGAIPGGGGGRGGGGAPGGESIEELSDFDALLQGGGQAQGQSLADDPTVPLKWRLRIGGITAKTITKLKEFVENGGHLLCIGSSALNISKSLNLGVESALVDDKGAPLPNTKFYIPGSILRMKLNQSPLTLGMEDHVDAMFDSSPSFKVTDPKADIVGLYDTDKPLRSGWAWGQEVLKGTASVVDVPLGKGRVVLYGPEILFRGQSYGTFKMLFNAIFRAAQK